jgi:hypothetical protein
MAHKPAGGLGSNKVVQRRAPKAEPVPQKINIHAVSTLGQAVAFKPEPLTAGRGYATPQGPSDNVAAVGVGGGRTLYGQSGMQHTHGPVRQGQPDKAPDIPGAKPGKDILKMYGPESK